MNNTQQLEPEITSDQSVLLAIYSAQSAAQLDYNERKWETIRSASLIILGVLAGVGGIASSDAANNRLILGFLGISLWVFGVAIFRWTNTVLRGESELQYYVEFSMYQIEKLLGAHGVVPETKRWLPEYKFALDRKHRVSSFHADDIDPEESNIDPLMAWVNARIRNHNFLKQVNTFSGILLLICLWIGATLLIIAIWGPQLQPAFGSSALLPGSTPISTP